MARVAVRLPHPCWLRLRRGGCGVSMGVEAPMLRALTRRGCPSGARSAKRVPRRTPEPPRRRFAPSHSEGVADWGSPFFWVLFFGEAKNKYLARRGESRPPPSTPACFSNQHALASTGSAGTSGQMPTTALQISPACDTANSTSPINPPTTVPLIRMYCRSLPMFSSISCVISSVSHRRTVSSMC